MGVDEYSAVTRLLGMSRSDQTRDKLLAAAKAAFWQHGYGHVSLRDIALAARVDVALVSRYFGGKLGLFNAALEGAFDWPEVLAAPVEEIGDIVVGKYANPEKATQQRSSLMLIVMNAGDPEVGPLSQQALEAQLLAPLRARLAERMGGDAAGAPLGMFVASVLGLGLVRQTLAIEGVSDAPPEVFADQLRHMLAAALSYRGA
jgi:AcrR family transcriptional regulator